MLLLPDGDNNTVESPLTLNATLSLKNSNLDATSGSAGTKMLTIPKLNLNKSTVPMNSPVSPELLTTHNFIAL